MLTSPSRATVTLTKTLSDNGEGFFSFNVSALESQNLVDNTYRYSLEKSGVVLKLGRVNLLE